MPESFIFFVGIMALAWFAWCPILLLVTLLTPTYLLEKYFKEPHFNAGELIIYGSFPGFFMRTALFFRLYLTPKAVKGRGLQGFVEESPNWFKLAVIVTSIGLLAHGFFVIFFVCLSNVIDYINSTS